jgi:tRNA(fMet)-specific endonuclease VapC
VKAVLDTNIYIDFAQAKADVVDLIAVQSTEILLPAVAVGELYYGFMKGNRHKYNEDRFHHFITSLEVRIIQVDEEVARKYAVIFLELSRKGPRIPINDVWIAASCMSQGGTLVTRDKHFEHVNQIDKVILP